MDSIDGAFGGSRQLRRGVRAGFALLCLLSGSAWIVDGYAPGVLPGLLRATVHQVLLTALFAGTAVALRPSLRIAVRLRMELALWGAALIGLPQVALTASSGMVPRLTQVLVFALVPAIVVFIEAQRSDSFGDSGNRMQWMLPALTGFGGAALVLPWALPGSRTGLAWLAMDCLAAGVAGLAAVRLHARLVRDELHGAAGVLEAAAVVCGSSALVTGLFCWCGWTPLGEITRIGIAQELTRCFVLDGPAVLLTTWLLGSMKPIGFAARYLLVPLVTVIEGYLWLRPETHWTLAFGVLLLAGSGVGLLTADCGDTGTSLTD